MYYAFINGFCVATGYDLNRLAIDVRSYPGVITITNSQRQALKVIKSKAKGIVEYNDLPSSRLLSAVSQPRRPGVHA